MAHRNFYSNQYLTKTRLHPKNEVRDLNGHTSLLITHMQGEGNIEKDKRLIRKGTENTEIPSSFGPSPSGEGNKRNNSILWKGGVGHMTNNGIVQIQGKDYMTVARRVELAHENRAIESIETEVLSHDPVVVRARVTIKGKLFTGISSVDLNSSKQIEKQNPYEVAETSAVGRALGFAGYGLIESIASADEMVKAGAHNSTVVEAEQTTCEVCGKPAVEKKGTTKGGKPYHGIFCSSEERSHTRWLWN